MPRKPHHVNIITTQYTTFIEYYKLHPDRQYFEIFKIINFKGHTLESTN
jgi:hypothetical protein